MIWQVLRKIYEEFSQEQNWINKLMWAALLGVTIIWIVAFLQSSVGRGCGNTKFTLLKPITWFEVTGCTTNSILRSMPSVEELQERE